MGKALFCLQILIVTTTFCFSQTREEITKHGKSIFIELVKSKKIQTQAIKQFSDPIRKAWVHVPNQGRGVSLNLIEANRPMLDQLLQSVLSASGFEKVNMILDTKSSKKFFFCFYGDPGADQPWGFSLEGPCLSLNITVVGNNISVTPMLLGANPTKIKAKDGKPDDIMRTEEGIPTDFMSMLDDGQRKKAVISQQSPDKLLFGLSPDLDFEQGGITSRELTSENQATFLSMTISGYLERVHKSLSEPMYDRLLKYRKQDLQLLWMGNIADQSEHYYRVTSPTLLIEYVNLEKEKNNVVSVLREKSFDFGERYLAAFTQTEFLSNGIRFTLPVGFKTAESRGSEFATFNRNNTLQIAFSNACHNKAEESDNGLEKDIFVDLCFDIQYMQVKQSHSPTTWTLSPKDTTINNYKCKWGEIHSTIKDQEYYAILLLVKGNQYRYAIMFSGYLNNKEDDLKILRQIMSSYREL